MGDRCYFSMDILKRDKKEVDRIMLGDCENCEWSEEHDEGDGTLTLIEYEANYAYYNQLAELAKAGIAFSGFHGHGGDYGEAVFACYGETYVEVSAIGSAPVAFIHEEGIVDEDDLKQVQEYYRLLGMVKRGFTGNNPNANS